MMTVAAMPAQLRLQQAVSPAPAGPTRMFLFNALPPPPRSLLLRRPSDLSALSLHLGRRRRGEAAVSSPSSSKIIMRAASTKQAYICRDCGYIYNERTPFDKLPDKFFCPVCGAPKRRFRVYEPAVAKDTNDTAVRKARKAQIKREEAIGQALPIAIVVGAAALAGLYLYLNNTF